MSRAIEQTLDSREVADMVEKEHRFLLRDIRRYVTQFNQCNLAPVGFFQESTYIDSKGETRPCYNITEKGCEFIAHKLTGTKGTIFTARYINRFHEMQDILSEKEPELPWFIRKFRGEYIVLERDFISITGVDIKKHKLFYRMEYFKGGLDWNGFGWKCDNDKFKQGYGFDYGSDTCMIYFYPCGVTKALRILLDDRKVQMNDGACETLTNGLKMIEKLQRNVLDKWSPEEISVTGNAEKNLPIQINIVLSEIKKVI